MDLSFLAPLVVIFIIGFIVNGRRESKLASEHTEKIRKQEELTSAMNAKNASQRLEQRRIILDTAKDLLKKWLTNADLSSDELSWLYDVLRKKPDKELEELVEELKLLSSTASKEEILGIKQACYEARVDTMKQMKVKEEREAWESYLKTFRQFNRNQQKFEIDRMKKIADPNSEEDSEKIRILELIRLQGFSDTGETDVLIGGYKLFTMRKK